MAPVLLVFAVGFLILSLIVFLCLDDEYRVIGCIPLVCSILFSLFGLLETTEFGLLETTDTEQNIQPTDIQPTALDVYRGKTTLQITYQDSIPVDTIVIFKEEYKK